MVPAHLVHIPEVNDELTVIPIINFFIFLLASWCGLRDLSSLTRD